MSKLLARTASRGLSIGGARSWPAREGIDGRAALARGRAEQLTAARCSNVDFNDHLHDEPGLYSRRLSLPFMEVRP